MDNRVGLWIDHKKAVIVVDGESAPPLVVQSDVPGHTRFTGGGGYPGGHSSQGGESERRREERHRNALDEYFDRVVEAIGEAQSVLIFGPGEAKHQFVDRLGRAARRPRPAITIDTADKLTDPQIVAKVSKYFDAHVR
jgi:hypothetical protein